MATYASIDITGQFDALTLSSGNATFLSVDITEQFDVIISSSNNGTFSSIDITEQFNDIGLSAGNEAFPSIDISEQFDTITLSSEYPQDIKLLPNFAVNAIVDPATILFNEGDSEPTLPVASFVPSALSGPVPLSVNFINTSSGTITETHWSFGDGGTSTDLNPSHTYVTSGTFTVSLRVFGGPYYSQATANITATAVNKIQRVFSVF